MKYIKDFKRLDKIKELSKNGDEGAKNFLLNFMDMDDNEANDYLSSIAIDEEKTEDNWKEVIEFLIKDENEAIDGYDRAIKYLDNANLDGVSYTRYKEVLEHIKNEELKHIEELKEII